MLARLPIPLLVGLSACSGALVIPSLDTAPPCGTNSDCAANERCVGGSCYAESAICSDANPTGVCPTGMTCKNGVCATGGSGWCDCTPEQGCNQHGECVPIEGNACTPQNPDGVCANGELCSGGYCVPRCEDCSFDNPAGCCPPGAACDQGICIAIDDRSCSPARPDGLCAPGELCEQGVCVPVQCGPDAATGSCGPEEMCVDGDCVQVPCSANHLGGLCGDGEFCSGAGRCLTVGTCAVSSDCSFPQFCSVSEQCLAEGDCAANEDCPARHTCELGVCQRDLACVDDIDCVANEFCSLVTSLCLPDGECAGEADCVPAEFCAGTRICIPDGTCQDDRDCPAAGDYCAGNATCIADGTCSVDRDCPPGHVCNGGSCTVGGVLCSATSNPSDCQPGERCSAAGSCIMVGACVDSTDCPSTYSCVDYGCVPNLPCTTIDDCNGGQVCSFTAGCIASGSCATSVDCPNPDVEVCGQAFTCVTGGCGATEFTASIVPPNMLVVLDRSGSMTGAIGSSTRWDEAVAAVDTLTSLHGSQIRFGLSTYPLQCTSNLCGNTCGGGNNCQPGQVDVAVGDNTRNAIMTELNGNCPGGYTPTGPSLRNIAANPGAFGLPDPADSIPRGNYVLLVTDGEPNCDAGNAPDQVNGAIEALRNLNPAVQTFVVGFAFGTVSATLNCNAVYGGTSRCGTSVARGTCTGATTCPPPPAAGELGAACGAGSDCLSGFCRNSLCSKCGSNNGCDTATNPNGACNRGTNNSCAHAYCTAGGNTPDMQTCDRPTCTASAPACTCTGSSTTPCYYEASDAASLSAAFSSIVGQVASCTYSLDQIPPDPTKLYVYFGTTLVTRDANHADGWDYDSARNQIDFYGPACDAVIAGSSPRVVYGCAGEGG